MKKLIQHELESGSAYAEYRINSVADRQDVEAAIRAVHAQLI
ncbi:MAG: hypothetical protein ACE5JP_02365 [Candidatus Bipolaricaulia bacterium]